MKNLATPIIRLIIEEYGTEEFLTRISDPLYFQALANALGYDWNSSGVTTVICAVLKEVLTPKMGLLVAGGKGKTSLQTPSEIQQISQTFRLSNKCTKKLIKTSKKVAKIDNAVLQDSHSLYHHSFFVSKKGKWSVVQQGMNSNTNSARRYHWTSEEVENFVIDPHTGIGATNTQKQVLNLPSTRSLETQRTSVDLVKDGAKRVKRDVSKLKRKSQGIAPLTAYFSDTSSNQPQLRNTEQSIEFKVNWGHLPWEKIKHAYELQPQNFEQLIQLPGIGPKTIRALALVSELIYETDLSWEDPARYSFAHGGKDGIPYPVKTDRMQEVSDFLRETVEETRLERKEKRQILQRLASTFKE